MGIEKIVIGAVCRDEDTITSPPERVLEIEVYDGIAWLTMQSGELASGNDPNEYFIKVPALSLKRALDLAIEDNETPQPQGLRGPGSTPS